MVSKSPPHKGNFSLKPLKARILAELEEKLEADKIRNATDILSLTTVLDEDLSTDIIKGLYEEGGACQCEGCKMAMMVFGATVLRNRKVKK